MIEMELFEIRIDETSSEQVIILKEKQGQRLLPIVIGMFEAQYIHARIDNFKHPRPLTYDLLVSLLGALGAEIERIVVNDLSDGTFYARIYVQNHGETVDVDARPSDAINIALRTDAPIYVEEIVFAKLGGE